MEVAKRFERPAVRFERTECRHRYLNVYHGFRRQSGHRRRTVMVDAQGQRPKHVMQESGDEVEPLLARLASPAPGPDRQAAGQQLRARIESVLQGLTPLERAAFTLRHLEQRPVEEISAVLGQSPTATRHSIFRAVAKMRRELAPLVRAGS